MLICPFCGKSASKVSGYKTVRCMRAGIKWMWYACHAGHEWGHKQV